MMQQKRIILPTIKRLNITLIKTCASLLCTTLLFTTQTAHADFRKALTAYQNRDGKTMLAEVQDAVDKKNDDGLILFISALQLDQILSKTAYVGEKERPQIYISDTKVNAPKMVLETLINQDEVQSLIKNLGLASKKSTFETQYEYLLLKYGHHLQGSEHIVPYEARRKLGEVEMVRNESLIKEMKLLAKKGYGKAAFYLGYPDRTPEISSDSWTRIAIKNGYQVEAKRITPLSTPEHPYISLIHFVSKPIKDIKKMPVLSVQRYATSPYPFHETNYFLDIYENGDVNYSRGMFADIPKSKQRIIQKLNKTELKQLVNDLKESGFRAQPIFSNIIFGDDMGHSSGFGANAITRTYIVTLREGIKVNTLNFVVTEMNVASAAPPFLIQLLKRIEKAVPTQFYRCGMATLRDYYQHCLEIDL
jgi:hypothetical protein